MQKIIEPKGSLLVGSHDMLHEAESYIASQWLKSVMKYKDKLGYIITVDADNGKNYPAVFPRRETNEEEHFTFTRHVIEERLRLWLAEG
jgi:hypothetical protein